LIPYDTVVEFFLLYIDIVVVALKTASCFAALGICAVPQAAFGGADPAGF